MYWENNCFVLCSCNFVVKYKKNSFMHNFNRKVIKTVKEIQLKNEKLSTNYFVTTIIKMK